MMRNLTKVWVPHEQDKHWAALRAVAPSLRQVPTNMFGDSGTNGAWKEVDMLREDSGPFAEKCRELGIYYWPDTAYTGRVCFKLCKHQTGNQK